MKNSVSIPFRQQEIGDIEYANLDLLIRYEKLLLWLRDRYIDTVEICQYLSKDKIIKCVECRGEQYDAGGFSEPRLWIYAEIRECSGYINVDCVGHPATIKQLRRQFE